MSTLNKSILVLAVLLAQAFFWNLGSKPMYKTQEIRVAETAREMLDSGDWLIPTFNGELRLRKPPLAYWLTAASYATFQAVNEFNARFSSAVFGSALCLALFLWLRRTLDERTALIAVATLATSYMGLRYFRSAETDAILLCFVTLACLQVYKLVFEGGGRKDARFLYLFMGLGFLTKGPAAIIMPLLTFAGLVLWNRDRGAWRKLADPLGIALFMLLAFGWYVAIYLKIPDLATYWVAEELDASYGSGVRPNPPWWYVARFVQMYLPWSLFLFPGAWWFYKQRPHPPVIKLALVWFAVTLLALSININKQIQYAFLLAPSFSVLLGYYLGKAQGGYARFNRILFGILFVAALAAIVIGAMKGKLTMSAFEAGVLLFSAMLSAALMLLLWKRKDAPAPLATLLLAGVMASCWAYGQNFVYTDAEEGHTRALATEAKQYEPLYVWRAGDPRASFYAQRVVPALRDGAQLDNALKASEGIFVIASNEASLAELQARGAQIAANPTLSLWKLSPP